MKNPPRQRGGGLKKSDCSSDSLAVFYVEQVALNRHVSSTDSIGRCYMRVKAFLLFEYAGFLDNKRYNSNIKSRTLQFASLRWDRREDMSKIDDLKAALESLPSDEFAEIFRWLSEKDWERWDQEIEADSQAGRLDFLVREARAEKAKGTLKDL